MRRELRRWVWVLCLALVPAGAARGAEDDTRLWLVVSAGTALTDEVSANLMVQGRFSNGMQDLERTVLRPSLSWDPGGPITFALGYDAHLFDAPDDRAEHRVWQQIGFATPAGDLGVGHRLRLEERFLEGVGGPALRLRYRLRLSHPVGAGGLSAIVSNEVAFNLNSPDDGPDGGFGEDRFFLGLGRELSSRLSVEAGYQLQFVERPGEDAANHILLVGLGF